jgi:hypothetical protein
MTACGRLALPKLIEGLGFLLSALGELQPN